MGEDGDGDGDADGDRGCDTGHDGADTGEDRTAPAAAEPDVLGWPPDGPKLRLDHRRFSYAGKFVMSNTGKAVIRDSDVDGAGADGVDDAFTAGPEEFDDDVLAAVAFNADRTDPETLWLRYVTVRADRRGDGLGPRLCAFVVRRAAERGYERARVAVNNPFAYEALYGAGFTYTAEETGLAELVLERPTDPEAIDRVAGEADDRGTERYQAGLDRFRKRDEQISDAERAFLERKEGQPPPEPELIPVDRGSPG